MKDWFVGFVRGATLYPFPLALPDPFFDWSERRQRGYVWGIATAISAVVTALAAFLIFR